MRRRAGVTHDVVVLTELRRLSSVLSNSRSSTSRERCLVFCAHNIDTREEEMRILRDYKIFISHVWDYHEEYQRLERLLRNAPNFKFTNLSVPKRDPSMNNGQLIKELQYQIQPAEAVLILAEMFISHRDLIQCEIDLAWRIGRPIIGIKPTRNMPIPLAFRNVVDELVGWNRIAIVAAIKRCAFQPL